MRKGRNFQTHRQALDTDDVVVLGPGKLLVVIGEERRDVVAVVGFGRSRAAVGVRKAAAVRTTAAGGRVVVGQVFESSGGGGGGDGGGGGVAVR